MAAVTPSHGRVFLAGASGAIGRRLSRLLVRAGYHVVGTTRTIEGAAMLRTIGVDPLRLDVFDTTAVNTALLKVRPEVVINQLTALSGLRTGPVEEALAANARIRSVAAPALVQAARAAGVRRFISQSIAWVYAPGALPHVEGDPLKPKIGKDAVTMGGVEALESATLTADPLEGIVLRYGWLYGPGTGNDAPIAEPSLHVDAAAQAAVLSIAHGAGGRVYNIADAGPQVSTAKAEAELEWRPDFRLPD